MLNSLRATLAKVFAAEPAADYPNRLALSAPQRERPPRAFGLLLLLVLATFIPRAIMAWRIDTICVDGIWYFHLADELERHERDPIDGGRLQLGTYPLALSSLHRLGFGWESSAEFYGLLVSTLAVVPLFAWVRRQFDDRVAVVACLLYAAHPKLIEWSPEAVREPSFWLFFLCALCFLWRAATEVDWCLYLAGGVSTALACLTRFEGWFLLFPFLGWSLLRLPHLTTGRLRLGAGLALGLCAMPVVFYGFSALLPSGTEWRNVRTEPIERAATWLRSWGDTEAAAVTNQLPATAAVAAQADISVAAAVASSSVATDWTFTDTLWLFIHTCERGLTPIFAILLFGGYFSRLRLFNRSDHWPVSLIALAVCGGIWVHLWYAHLASSRYVQTIVLLATRAAAVGLLDFCHFAGARLTRWRPLVRTGVSTALVSLVLLVGVVDALSSDFRGRESLASLGRWIQAVYGESTTVVGSESQMPLVGYYARAKAVQFPTGLSRDQLVDWVTGMQPDVVLISTRVQSPSDYQPLLEQTSRLGLEQVPVAQMPYGLKNIIMLTRPRPQSNPLQQATRLRGRSP